MQLTETERRILRALQLDGRMSNVELAQKVGLSETPCLRRVRALEDSGVISRYSAIVDCDKVGFPVSAIVLVNTNQRTETDRREFRNAVRNEPQVLSCAAISGSHDFVLRVIAPSVEELADLLMKRLLGLPNVADLSSSIVLKWIKRHEPVPV